MRYTPPPLTRETGGGGGEGKAEGETEAKAEKPAPLIAWAFLGSDGSLTSLHVEPAHRSKGIGTLVAEAVLRLLSSSEGGFFAGGLGAKEGSEEARLGSWAGYAHSDVAVGNEGSAGVARELGGWGGWRVRWVGVELGG